MTAFRAKNNVQDDEGLTTAIQLALRSVLAGEFSREVIISPLAEERLV